MGLLFQLSEKPVKVQLQHMNSISTASKKSDLKINYGRPVNFVIGKSATRNAAIVPLFVSRSGINLIG